MTVTVKGNTLKAEIDISKTIEESAKGNEIVAGTDFWEKVHETDEHIYSARWVLIRKSKKKKTA